MIRLVLFDIDGTLIRTNGAGVRAFELAVRDEFDIADGTKGVSFAGRTDSSLVREILVRHGREPTPEAARRFFTRYVFWLDHLLAAPGGFVCPGVRQLMEGLAGLAEPPALGLLTGNIRLGAEIKLRRFDLWEAFITGAFGDDHEDRNQLSVIAQERGSRVLGRALAGREILVIGDTPRDVECGRAIGARTLAVATGGASLEELVACHPDWAVPDLRQLTASEMCA